MYNIDKVNTVFIIKKRLVLKTQMIKTDVQDQIWIECTANRLPNS